MNLVAIVVGSWLILGGSVQPLEENVLDDWGTINESTLVFLNETNKYSRINVIGEPGVDHPEDFVRVVWRPGSFGPTWTDTVALIWSEEEKEEETSFVAYEILSSGNPFIDGAVRILQEGEVEIPFHLGNCLESVGEIMVRSVEQGREPAYGLTLHADVLVIGGKTPGSGVQRRLGPSDRLADLWLSFIRTLQDKTGFKKAETEALEWSTLESECEEVLAALESE